jgi:hypothetical protein
MKTTKSTTKALRPSPTASATLFPVGKTMKGNDGNLWKIAKTKDGVKRWNKVTAEAKTTTTAKKTTTKAKASSAPTLSLTQKAFQDICYYIKTGKHLTADGEKITKEAIKFLYGKYIPSDPNLFAYRLATHLKYNGKGAFVNATLRKNGLKIDIGGKEVVKK